MSRTVLDMVRSTIKRPNVSAMKQLIGNRVRTLRADTSQEAIEAASGVDRGIIGSIERGDRDYRIDSLLRVLKVLSADVLDIIFAPDPLAKQLHDAVARIYKAGVPSETHFLMEAIRRAEAGIDAAARARSGPSHGKPPRSA